ncbi:hypothetical protein BP5796_10238 [Coleophoma crateriformis]|uniref:Uncharacterized protein n=1 Tax=Coleophoma crateriformis TaxID=565419 RepID=A0A3D8QUM3_9HELO|nr:hypothetical protein BP5796_10238 [Coleophoma crateriformis]
MSWRNESDSGDEYSSEYSDEDPAEYSDEDPAESRSGNGLQPGCSEYLESLLTYSDGGCRHPNQRLRAEQMREIPKVLCFFSQNSSNQMDLLDDIYFVQTKKLCMDCYSDAVPNGFNVWSTTYFDEYDKQYDNNPKGLKRKPYPRLLEARTRKPAPFTSQEYPRFPGALIVHECWRYLVYRHDPFYIDELCIHPPYKVYNTPEQRQREDDRISSQNIAAYLGAELGVIGTASGGAGKYSVEEQRILGDRAKPVPAQFGDPNALMELGEGYIVDGDTHWVPALFTWGGKLNNMNQAAFHWLAQFQHTQNVFRAPSAQEVDAMVFRDTGRHVSATPDERRRRARELSKRPQEPECFRAMMNALRGAQSRSNDGSFKLSRTLSPDAGSSYSNSSSSRMPSSSYQTTAYQSQGGGKGMGGGGDWQKVRRNDDNRDEDEDDYRRRYR